MSNIAKFYFKKKTIEVEYSHATSVHRYVYAYNPDLFYLGCTNNLVCDNKNEQWSIDNHKMDVFISKKDINKQNVKMFFLLLNNRKKNEEYEEEDFFLESYLTFFYKQSLRYVNSDNVYQLQKDDIIHSKHNIYKILDIKYNLKKPYILLENIFFKDNKKIFISEIDNYSYKSKF